jgi:hypothetical protein
MAFHLKLAEKAQSEAFFTAYLVEARRVLAVGNGFPLTRDQSKPVGVENFMAAAKQLKYVSDDMASATFKSNAPRNSDDWKKFVENVESQQALARALLGEDVVLGSCTISLASPTEATRAKDEWRGSWRDIKLVFDGGNTETVRTESEGDPKLGDAPVQQKLEFRLIRNAGDSNSPTHPIVTPEWGPLWLIQHYKGEPDKGNRSVWLVEFPVGAPGANGAVRLKLKFERALPELDKWPSR